MGDFNFIIPLQKNAEDRLTGIASTTVVDRDDEKMSDSALHDMADDIRREGVNLFGNHEHSWENILGGIDHADVLGKQLQIGINLNRANPKYAQLTGTLATKGVKLGLSVGGNVGGFRWEYDREKGKKIKVLDKVKVYEVSVVGIPSNAESFLSVSSAIAKSAKPKGLNCPACFSEIAKGLCPTCFWKEG
jgi:HK97 family phage prohead protease